MKRKNIDWFSIVLSDTQAGGSEQQQIQLFRYLLEQGASCQVICLSRKEMGCWQFMEEKGKVVYFPFSSKYLKINFILLFPYLFFLLFFLKISYSFTTQTLINSSVGIFRKLGFLRETKIIVRESNMIFDLLKGRKLKLYLFAYRLGYSFVDLIICQTDYMKNRLIHHLPWLEKRVKVCTIGNPIDLESITEKAKEAFTEKHLKPYIVAAGSLHPKKGFDLLIDAFSKLSSDYSDLKLLILGEGYLRPTLEQKIITLGLQNKVVLKGFVKNVYPYFKHSQVCVLSSRIEGFPNVLLQMMSQNTKVVSTLSAGDIESIPKIHIVPTENIPKLRSAIQDALEEEAQDNRAIFDEFLKKREVPMFLDRIMQELKTK